MTVHDQLTDLQAKLARLAAVNPAALPAWRQDRLAVAIRGALRWIDAALVHAEGMGRGPKTWPDGTPVTATEEGGRQ